MPIKTSIRSLMEATQALAKFSLLPRSTLDMWTHAKRMEKIVVELKRRNELAAAISTKYGGGRDGMGNPALPKPDHADFAKACGEIEALNKLEVEIDLEPIPFSTVSDLIDKHNRARDEAGKTDPKKLDEKMEAGDLLTLRATGWLVD